MTGARRKAVIKTQPVKKAYSLTQLAGKAHRHFCSDRTCRLIYFCACENPEINARCQVCRGTSRAIWTVAADPAACCYGNCTQVTDREELLRYQLAGPGPWFQCLVCARCHGWPCNIPLGNDHG